MICYLFLNFLMNKNKYNSLMRVIMGYEVGIEIKSVVGYKINF